MSISVIIPSYNRADLLPRTLGSIAAQTLLPSEVVIVDDESQDNTPEVVDRLQKEFTNITITYICHEKNRGEAGARNTGIRAASGEYLAFLDSDDEWIPEKLEKQKRFLDEQGLDGVFCEYYQVTDEDYDKAEHISYSIDRIAPKILMTGGCGYGVGTNLMIKRSATGDNYFDEDLRLFTDLDWVYRVVQHATIGILHEPLSYYHKAPMRPGDYIAQRVDQFYGKYADHLAQWPVLERMKVKSQMNWYIATAYKGNNHNFKAAKHYALGILQCPVRHPGHYIECVKCLINSFGDEKKRV